MMASDALKLVMMRNYGAVVDTAKRGEIMPLEDRLMQRSQSSVVPKICLHHIDELLRACGASGLWRSNPIERYYRDVTLGRGHIANNADHYARIQGAVALGLPNPDPFV